MVIAGFLPGGEILIGCLKKKIIFTNFNPNNYKRTLPNQYI